MGKIIKTYAPITAGVHDQHEINQLMLIDEYIDKHGVGLVGPYICVVNDKPISRVHWNSFVIEKDDIMIFMAFPQGGGDGGSSPIKVIAMIGVMALAVAVPGMPLIAGVLGTGFWGAMGGGLISGAIMFGGSYLVNLAFPPTTANDTEISKQRAGSSVSSYNINDRGNVSSLNNAIQVQYGKMKHYPSYAMQTWSEFIDNEQHAYLQFCHGHGEYDFGTPGSEDFYFADVKIDELDECYVVTFDKNQTQPSVGGSTFYNNVFTSSQVQNLPVKRVKEYTVTVPGTIKGLVVEAGDNAEYGSISFAAVTWDGFKGITSKYDIFDADIDRVTTSPFIFLGDIINKAVDGFNNTVFEIYNGPTGGPTAIPIGTSISSPWPVEWKALWMINYEYTPSGASDPINCQNGVFGNVDFYDGFVAGDKIEFVDSVSGFLGNFTIVQVEYFTDTKSGQAFDAVAYTFAEPVPYGYLVRKESYMRFLPGSLGSGYIVPSRNNTIQKIAIDISLPNGLYKINTTTGDIESTTVQFNIEYKNIYSNGSEDASWTVSSTETLTAATKSALNYTYDFSISGSATKARVRINRDFGTADEYADKSSDVNTMVWVGLKAFLPNTTNYGEVTMISVKTKVSNSLISTSLSEFNAVATRKLPTYNGSVWSSPVATRNPAWAMADACRNSEYSIGVSDSELDIDKLYSLSQTFASRGDYCDGIFDSKEVFWDALTKIARVGRSQPLMIAGAISFVRDEPKTIPKQVFTIENVQAGSFVVDYLAFEDDTPDSVTLEYFDNEEWVWKEVTEPFASGGDTDQPAEVQRWGITTSAHATRDAKYEAACNAYRRKLPQFTCELEGRILNRLDLVSVSNPRVGYGISGYVIAVSGKILTLSEEAVFDAGDHYIAFREKNGEQDGPYIVTAVSGEPYQVEMAVTPPVHIYTGYEHEKTQFQFGAGSTYEKKCLVGTVQPQGLETVKLTCIVDDPRVYTADGTTGL